MPISEQALSEWIKLFPQRASEDSINSATFIKQLTVVAISVITYLKDAIPRDNYMIESLGGIKLHILNKKCRNGVAQFLVSALADAFDALDKQYLHKLALCFYKDECKLESLIECHTFAYLYKNDDVTMSVQSQDNSRHSTEYTFENIREQTIKLIKFYIVLMESSDKLLPSSYGVSLRLYYHQDAPAEYHAPGFMCATDQTDHLECDNLKMLKVLVNTRFHRVVARSYVADKSDGRESSHNAVINRSGSKETSVAECQLVCACNNYSRKDVYKAHELLTCCYCSTQQHAPCYGVRREDAPLVKEHCCARCHDADASRRPTDVKLATVPPEKRAFLCLFRRALEYCSRRGDVSAQSLVAQFVLPRATARALMRFLCDSDASRRESDFDPNISQAIVKEQLDKFRSKYLSARESRADDCTLKRYRDALVPEEIEDSLPVDAFAKIRKRNELRPNLSTLKTNRAKLQTKK